MKYEVRIVGARCLYGKDVHDKKTRSFNMSRSRSKDKEQEIPVSA